MKNRYGIEFKKGYSATCQHHSGMDVRGTIEKIQRENGRGIVVTLDCGLTFSPDDVAHSWQDGKLFFVEITDTYGGEANYSWVSRYMVHATSFQGVASKIGKEGYHARKDYDTGDGARYNVSGACICYFVRLADGSEFSQYGNLKEI